MKTSTVMTLSLCLLYLCGSNSQSLSSIEICNCESWDEECWDDCLSGQFAQSNTLPLCGKIKACQHITCKEDACKNACKDVPKTLPWRCGDRKTEFPCGLIIACRKHQQHPFCKDVPSTLPRQCTTPGNVCYIIL